MTAGGRRWGGRWAQRLVAATLASKGTVCRLCHHDGADSADHTIPRARGGADTVANLEPVHHKPCPTCGRRCNQQRGTRDLAPAIVPAEFPDLAYLAQH